LPVLLEPVGEIEGIVHLVTLEDWRRQTKQQSGYMVILRRATKTGEGW
jgi:hypothetical protein